MLTGKTPVQISAGAVGAVFLLVGVLGFVPGVTTDYHEMTVFGHHSAAMLLGVFSVSVLHNIVHLLFGVTGLALARTPRSARRFLIVGGIIYLVLWLYGLVIDQTSPANFVPVNTADNWLHLLLGIAMISLSVITSRTAATHAQ